MAKIRQNRASERLACVSVPALPLQLLLKKQPQWQGHPTAVVTEDRPEGRVLWVNSQALKTRVLPGLRYISALALAPDLRAGIVSEREVKGQVRDLVKRLGRFSPDVEPYREVPGTFWLNASGLGLLHPSLEHWAEQIRADLREMGLRTRVAVGFTRFGSYAAATSCRGVVAFETLAAERAAASRVKLERLETPHKTRDALLKLGITDVAGLLNLPAGGLRIRFGPELHRLHRLATGDLGPPLAPTRIQEPLHQQLDLDFPERDAHRLLFCIKRLLHPLLLQVSKRGEAVAELGLWLALDRESRGIDERVRPAAPCLDEVQLTDLLRLKLEHLRLGAGVVEVRLSALTVRASHEQLRFFADTPRRDLAAGERALARVRSEFGEESVVQARLREAHLPEASFCWEPLTRLRRAEPRPTRERPLVRSLRAHPLPLPPRLRLSPDGWLLKNLEHGSVMRMFGPYTVSGGWWRKEVHREYHFAEMQKGQLLWIYNDRRRRRWYVHGEVL